MINLMDEIIKIMFSTGKDNLSEEDFQEELEKLVDAKSTEMLKNMDVKNTAEHYKMMHKVIKQIVFRTFQEILKEVD